MILRELADIDHGFSITRFVNKLSSEKSISRSSLWAGVRQLKEFMLIETFPVAKLTDSGRLIVKMEGEHEKRQMHHRKVA
ncbi:MAG: hypothetical protein HYX24_01095 [Candidatus Aenigmarchaeota archaeon]|nr:hypothetical protein [Candidatus Aenigmarchaeota archaeon]